MTIKITQISSELLGRIEVGSDYIFNCPTSLKGKKVSQITIFRNGDNLPDTYFVKFEGTPQTLEVFDVNYVIRDEE